MHSTKLVVVAERERREKARFPFERDVRYKVIKDEAVLQTGVGRTVNMSSGGVAFSLEREIPAGAYIELAISWPVLLGNLTPMRMIVYGRVLRTNGTAGVCSIDKYEFRTQARNVQPMPARTDSKLQRWIESRRELPVSCAHA